MVSRNIWKHPGIWESLAGSKVIKDLVFAFISLLVFNFYVKKKNKKVIVQSLILAPMEGPI